MKSSKAKQRIFRTDRNMFLKLNELFLNAMIIIHKNCYQLYLNIDFVLTQIRQSRQVFGGLFVANKPGQLQNNNIMITVFVILII